MENSTNKSSLPMIIVGVVVLLLIVGGVVLTTQGDNSSSGEDMAPNPTMSANMNEDASGAAGGTVPAESEDGVVTVEVNAGSYFFSPEEIRVKQGDTVRILLTNVDEVGSPMMHDFVIDELDVDSGRLAAGEATTFEFVADQAGEFEFYCSVGNHRAMGQVGTLIVE